MPDPRPSAPPVNLNLSWSKISAVGTRDINEDALSEGQLDNMVCFVMSDGAGGHACGDIAAHIVVDTVRRSFLREATFSPRAVLAYIETAIAAVMQSKRRVPEQQDMSATVATVLIDQRNRRALWAHLGDTRVYLFRNKRLRAVTKDHSVAQQFVDAGYAAPEQLRSHPQRHVLFAAIGVEGAATGPVSGEPVSLGDGDALLICTDGFWEAVLESDMESCLGDADSSAEWLTAMCIIGDHRAAATHKARDNYSACAIWLREPGEVI